MVRIRIVYFCKVSNLALIFRRVASAITEGLHTRRSCIRRGKGSASSWIITSEVLRYCMARVLKGSHSFTCTPTR